MHNSTFYQPGLFKVRRQPIDRPRLQFLELRLDLGERARIGHVIAAEVLRQVAEADFGEGVIHEHLGDHIIHGQRLDLRIAGV